MKTLNNHFFLSAVPLSSFESHAFQLNLFICAKYEHIYCRRGEFHSSELLFSLSLPPDPLHHHFFCFHFVLFNICLRTHRTHMIQHPIHWNNVLHGTIFCCYIHRPYFTRSLILFYLIFFLIFFARLFVSLSTLFSIRFVLLCFLAHFFFLCCCFFAFFFSIYNYISLAPFAIGLGAWKRANFILFLLKFYVFQPFHRSVKGAPSDIKNNITCCFSLSCFFFHSSLSLSLFGCIINNIHIGTSFDTITVIPPNPISLLTLRQNEIRNEKREKSETKFRQFFYSPPKRNKYVWVKGGIAREIELEQKEKQTTKRKWCGTWNVGHTTKIQASNDVNSIGNRNSKSNR